MSELPSGTVTFLFSDIEGSTRLLKELGDAYADVLGEHQRLVRAAIAGAGGQEIDTQGDAFFVAFRRARDAVAAAVDIQRTHASHSWPNDAEVRVRIGLHTGEPLLGSDRYVGIGVHRAARICAAAHGGQILVSQTTRELVRDDTPAGTSLRDLGEHQLKDLAGRERLFQVVAPGLTQEFPPPKTVAVESAAGREYRILGSLEVLDAGQPLALGGHKQRSLLALLLLRANEVVPSERLIEELWGESPPRTAATSLQNFVSQLRKTLGPDVLVTRAPGYQLRVEPDELDLARFERLTRDARELEPEERARTLRRALGLWRGPPLTDFTYEAFAEGEIRRLEELRLLALEELFDAELKLEHDSDVIAQLESLVREHPLRERLRGQLMLALYRTGRQPEALQTYHDLRELLVEQLGIDPSPELQRLHTSILRHDTRLDRAGSAPVADDHYGDVLSALLAARLVMVLGPDVAPRDPADVVEHLAKTFGYPTQNGTRELPRVSQYIATMSGVGPLYDALHELYAELAPGDVHRFVASLPHLLRARGLPNPLVVTTGYDLALERALAEANEEFDVVAYVAAGRNRGRFWHLPPKGTPQVIEVPNTYAAELALERRPVVLKLHGCVDTAPTREWESFVVTEDDYIDYLARDDLANLIPVGLTAKLRRSHFLFLGYALRDWNLRVLLNRLWGEEKVGYRSWAVQRDAPPLEIEFWRRRDVDVFELPLDEYAHTLEARLAEVRV